MMRIAPTAGATSACRSTKPAARRCRRRWSPRCRRCGPPSNSGGIRCWASPGSEADDLAATLAVKVAQAGHQATIVSTDKGYCQLLSPTIRIRDYFQKRWLDAPFIASEFGVTPEQLADYWGLAGISSSKVPGVAGIGPKSAAQLLNEFQDLEGLYARLAEVPEKWRKKLAAHQEMAFTCREVARLQTDLQLDGNLQQLRLTR